MAESTLNGVALSLEMHHDYLEGEHYLCSQHKVSLGLILGASHQ